MDDRSFEELKVLAITHRRRSWAQACEADIAQFCQQEADTIECLKNKRRQLTSCCQAFTTQMTQGSMLKFATFYRGVLLPAGSTISHADKCATSSAVTTGPVDYSGMKLRKGRIQFSGDGGVVQATLDGEQNINGFWFSDSLQPTRFHRTGIPRAGTLSRPSKTLFGTYGPWRGQTRFFDDGSVSNGFLTEPHEIDGVWVGPGVIRLGSPGELAEAVLARDTKVGGLRLPRGTRILGSLHKGHLTYTAPALSKVGDLIIAPHTKTVVSPNHALSTGTLGKATMIENKALPAGTEVKFRYDGVLKWDSHSQAIRDTEAERIRKLTEPRKIESAITNKGVTIPAGSTVFRDGSGKLIAFSTEESFNFNGITLSADKYIFGHEYGITAGRLDTDQRVGSFNWSAKDDLVFHSNGLIKTGTLSGRNLYEQIEFQNGSLLHLSIDGRIKEGTLAHDQEIDGVWLKGGSTISFSRENEIKSGTLAKATVFHYIEFPPDSVISFNGSPEKFEPRKINSATSHVIEGLVLDGQNLSFGRDGIFTGGRLSEDATIAGEKYLKGTRFLLNDAGFVVSSFYQKPIPEPTSVIADVGVSLIIGREEPELIGPMPNMHLYNHIDQLVQLLNNPVGRNMTVRNKKARPSAGFSLGNSSRQRAKYEIAVADNGKTLIARNIPGEDICSHYKLSVGNRNLNSTTKKKLSVRVNQLDLHNTLSNVRPGTLGYRTVCRQFKDTSDIIYSVDLSTDH